MSYDLPSLNALRAFEATARHLAFKAAASELHVTPGAISQHVKALEEDLGVRLFDRHSRGIELTGPGQALYGELRKAFQAMAGAVEGVRAHERIRPLTVSIPPSLAVKWLVPRLGRFRESHPDIDVRISANTRLVDFAREDVDLAIRCGAGDYPGMHGEFLMEEDSFPVCSPRLLAQGPPLREPADLRHYTLLHDESYPGWQDWFAAQGVYGFDLTRGPVFPNAAMALEAALEGQGVAISYTPLAYSDLVEGRLVRPFESAVANTFAYYLVCPPERLARPKIKAFWNWVIAEAEAEGYRTRHDATPLETAAAD